MRIAYVSDVHLEFYQNWPKLPEKPEADIIVVAGDIHPQEKLRMEFLQLIHNAYQLPIYAVHGNHDYYGGVFPREPKVGFKFVEGHLLAWATLWTKLDEVANIHKSGLNDFFQIDGCTVPAWDAIHQQEAKQLFDLQPHIVITHHAPSYKSVPKEFLNSELNRFYASHLDHRIENSGIRLWIHGHMHEPVDYMIGDCHVCSNPHGYFGYEHNRRQITVQVVEA